MIDDLTLLRVYVNEGAEDAFRTVVERHLGLVHSAALRQVGDPHLAQEVTQAVFLILARKAASLSPETILVGWLFRTTRFAASEALRAARRRRRYEEEAAQMLPTTTPSEAPWDEIAPHLDEAVAGLGETDRHAILLRFFERKEMKEVGAALGSSEDAAKKRVSRALDKIRQFLMRRGIALSAAALGSALMTNVVQAAPAPLLQTIVSTVAADGIAATTTTLELVLKTMKAMFLTQLQKAAAIAALLLIAVGLGSLFAYVPTQNAPTQTATGPNTPPTEVSTAATSPASGSALAWDAEDRKYQAGPGELNVPFVFRYTNVSAGEVVIHAIRTSCGCTVLKNGPVLPHRLAPGDSDQLEVAMNLAGKSGTVVKTVVVDTSAGTKTLIVRAEIPAASSPGGFKVPEAASKDDTRRAVGLAAAAADRQAIFKGDCAKCHVEPATGKEGKDLYVASCGICHDAEHRASMVPDLKALTHPTTPEYWRTMIANGKPGTLMPAFAEEHGGNLTETQIASLVKHLAATIPSKGAPTKATSKQ